MWSPKLAHFSPAQLSVVDRLLVILSFRVFSQAQSYVSICQLRLYNSRRGPFFPDSYTGTTKHPLELLFSPIPWVGVKHQSPPSREKKAMGPGSSQGLHLTQLSYKAVAAHRWVSGGRDRTKQDLGMFPEHSAMWCFTLQNLLSICMT
jgi:hypothetical protein